MKILVINTVRFKMNGISAVIMNYYNAMDMKDIKMEFVAIDDPSVEYKEIFSKNSICYYVVKKKNIFKYFLNLYRVAKQGNYDIVHIHGNSANMAIELLACYFAGIKIRIAHSHNTSTLHPKMHKLLHPLFTLLCTNRFACGKDAGKWLFEDKPFIELKNGINLDEFYYNEATCNTYRNKIKAKNRTVIGHIGNFIDQKNHGFLLDIFADLIKKDKNYLLLLISDGPLFENIKQKAHELNLDGNILFLGKTTDIKNYLQAMDIFILPSLYEGLPLVLVEAQASGLPCIVSNKVDREVDLTNSMRFVPIKNPNDWVEVIEFETLKLNKRNRSDIQNDWKDKIIESGFDISKNAEYLKSLYCKYKGDI